VAPSDLCFWCRAVEEGAKKELAGKGNKQKDRKTRGINNSRFGR
jgi:hypothetical protein